VKNIAGQIEVVLFDLGGVLVEMHGVPTMLAWLNHSVSADELWKLWLTSPVVRGFETGRTGPDEFADRIIQEMSLPVGREEFLNTFSGWVSGLYPGALELVRSVPARFTRATLSNSSVLHWARVMNEFELEGVFDRHFASHLTGKIKPDPEAFQFVIESLGCRPSAIFFLDDNSLNVEAAHTAGMHAVRTKGLVEARNALREAGILSPVQV
jgi:HAD superfamily hydrolase (TIGR01509 family)